MKRVIDGKLYDTDTAIHICELPCSSDNSRDFKWHETSLYKSPKGQFFVAGTGGPMSLWAVREGNATSGSSGLRLVDAEEAQMICESVELDADDILAAGLLAQVG